MDSSLDLNAVNDAALNVIQRKTKRERKCQPV